MLEDFAVEMAKFDPQSMSENANSNLERTAENLQAVFDKNKALFGEVNVKELFEQFEKQSDKAQAENLKKLSSAQQDFIKDLK